MPAPEEIPLAFVLMVVGELEVKRRHLHQKLDQSEELLATLMRERREEQERLDQPADEEEHD